MEIEIKMVDGEKIRMDAKDYTWDSKEGVLAVRLKETCEECLCNIKDVMYVSPVCELHYTVCSARGRSNV